MVTADEMATRLAVVSDVRGYRVLMVVDGSSPTFRTTTAVDFDCRSPGASTWVDVWADAVHHVELNGRAIPHDAWDGHRLHLDGLGHRNHLRVAASFRYSDSSRGVFRQQTDAETVVYSDNEPAFPPSMFACFNQLDLPGPVTLSCVAPDGWEVVSSTSIVATTSVGLGPGRRLTAFRSLPALPPHLPVLVAGTLRRVTAGGPVPLAVVAPSRLLENADLDRVFHLMRAGIAAGEELFGRAYPYSQLQLVVVPGRQHRSRAMENPGCIVAGERLLLGMSRRAFVSSESRGSAEMALFHEIVHHWIGDLWTAPSWETVALIEAMTTAAGFDLQERFAGGEPQWDHFILNGGVDTLQREISGEARPLLAPVTDSDDAQTIFTDAYHKGPVIVRQLREWMGRDALEAGVRDVVAGVSPHAVGVPQVVATLQQHTSRDLHSWFDEWCLRPGITTLVPHPELAPDGTLRRLVIEQRPDARHPGLRSHRVVIGLYQWCEGLGLQRCARIETDIAGERTAVPAALGHPYDLMLVNDEDLTLARVCLDQRSLQAARRHLREIPSSTTRALIWRAAWDMMVGGELGPADLVTLIAAQMGGEDRPETTGWLWEIADDALLICRDHEWTAGRVALADTAVAILREPGAQGPRVVQALIALIRLAEAPQQLAWLEHLAEDVYPTLSDQIGEQQARAAFRLVEIGRWKAERAGHVLRDDPGRRDLLRLMEPTSVAKDEAWERCLQWADASEPYLTVSDLAQAFTDCPHQQPIIEPYWERYVSEVPEWWKGDVDRAAVLTDALFPRCRDASQTLALVDRLLARTDLDPRARALLEDRVRSNGLLARAERWRTRAAPLPPPSSPQALGDR